MELTAHEKYIKGEDEAIVNLTEMLRKKMLKDTPPPETVMRDAHPKQIGLLKGEFRIEEKLPNHLRIGVFSEQKTFPCWVRFSNQNSPQKADVIKDIRGVAIKLMSVAGDKILEKEKHEETQDFILISTSYFVTKNIVQFAKLIKSLVSGGLWLMWFFITHPKVTYNLLTSNKNFGSLLEARFWSVSPYLFGEEVVKYSLKPSDNAETPIPSKPTYNYLSEVMTSQLKEKDYSFDFMIQLQKDPLKMPVEKLSNPWSESESPFIKVATLTIPKQEFYTPAQQEFGDTLSFTPWHSLPEHRPLGNINRGRRIVYDKLSEFRHKENNTPRFEPTDFSLTIKKT